jgi:alkylation response protein AidB-like acyl-CoA dehydrogenase
MDVDGRLNPEETAAIAAARTFADAVVAPAAQDWERRRAVPSAVYDQAGAAGLMRLLPAPELGGLGLGVTALARVMEELASQCMAFAFSLVVHNNLVGNIARNGSPAQQSRYLPDLMAGSRIGAFLLTEPTGGSDAAAIQTKATAIGADRWRIDGAKAWVSNGAVADVLSVYVQTDASAGWRGIACFLVAADSPGVIREPAYDLMGGHALGTGGFRFDGCEVTADDRLLPPGAAFKAAMEGIDLARLTVAAMCCGMMRSALDCALGYTATRQAFGQSTASFQGLQWMLADAATDQRAARLLTYDAAMDLDSGRDATEAAAHAKKFATRAALARIADCMQAMGAIGYRGDYPLGRHLAAAKMAQFLDGTTEIQNVVIARKLFGG